MENPELVLHPVTPMAEFCIIDVGSGFELGVPVVLAPELADGDDVPSDDFCLDPKTPPTTAATITTTKTAIPPNIKKRFFRRLLLVAASL